MFDIPSVSGAFRWFRPAVPTGSFHGNQIDSLTLFLLRSRANENALFVRRSPGGVRAIVRWPPMRAGRPGGHLRWDARRLNRAPAMQQVQCIKMQQRYNRSVSIQQILQNRRVGSRYSRYRCTADTAATATIQLSHGKTLIATMGGAAPQTVGHRELLVTSTLGKVVPRHTQTMVHGAPRDHSPPRRHEYNLTAL